MYMNRERKSPRHDERRRRIKSLPPPLMNAKNKQKTIIINVQPSSRSYQPGTGETTTGAETDEFHFKVSSGPYKETTGSTTLNPRHVQGVSDNGLHHLDLHLVGELVGVGVVTAGEKRLVGKVMVSS